MSFGRSSSNASQIRSMLVVTISLPALSSQPAPAGAPLCVKMVAGRSIRRGRQNRFSWQAWPRLGSERKHRATVWDRRMRDPREIARIVLQPNCIQIDPDVLGREAAANRDVQLILKIPE